MTQRQRILLVEDDPDTREVMALLLETADYEVLTARDAAAALRLIDEQPLVDVIVTDVNIGLGQDGVSMAEEIRRRGSRASIVVVSGDPEASTARLGATATFLRKPYDRKTLLGAIADACTRNAHRMPPRPSNCDHAH